MPRVLLVEDDVVIVGSLTRYLIAQGYDVESASSGADALQLLNAFPFEVIILDWQLDDISGLEVCKRFRQNGGTTPILFLTGMGDIDDKEIGLDSGADDYMVKPFEARELSARLRTLLRRPPSLISNTELQAAGVVLTLETRTVCSGALSVRLSPRECALLEYLMRHPNRNFTSAFLRDSVWPLDADISEETVRTCMRTLRKKLEKIERLDLIKTEPGFGYKIES